MKSQLILQEPEVKMTGNAERSAAFELHFQKAILLSLLENHRITKTQYDQCADRLQKKKAKTDAAPSSKQEGA